MPSRWGPSELLRRDGRLVALGLEPSPEQFGEVGLEGAVPLGDVPSEVRSFPHRVQEEIQGEGLHLDRRQPPPSAAGEAASNFLLPVLLTPSTGADFYGLTVAINVLIAAGLVTVIGGRELSSSRRRDRSGSRTGGQVRSHRRGWTRGAREALTDHIEIVQAGRDRWQDVRAGRLAPLADRG